MAKGGPEVGNTVPIKDANGNVTGWTTPEYALELGIIDAPSTGSGLVLGPGDDGTRGTDYIPPTQTIQTGSQDPMTAFEDDTWNIFDPITGEYVQHSQTDDPFFYNPRGDQTNWVYDQAGNRILMDTTGENWEQYGAYNPELEGWQVGYQPDGTYGTAPPPPTTQPPPPTTQPPPPTTQPPTTGTPITPPPPAVAPDPDPWIPLDWDLINPGAPDVPNDRDDLPTPPGGPVEDWTGEGAQADTSWDWDAFAPKRQGDGAWGGYDQDYQAFERYQPGMESPWGMPDVMGGNKSFYQQQFVNQLRDEQGFQNRERAAQARRQDAIENPLERAPDDWSWANGGKGLGQVVTGTGVQEDNRAWGLLDGFNTDMTNADVVRRAQELNNFRPGQLENMNAWLNPRNWEGGEENTFFTGGNWSKLSDPAKGISSLSTNPKELTTKNREWITDMLNTIYQRQGDLGPGTPAGYASPLASYPTTTPTGG